MRQFAAAHDDPRNMFTVHRHREFTRGRILGGSGRRCRERHDPRWRARRRRDRDRARGRTLLDILDRHSSARAPEAASLAIQCRAVGYARSQSRVRRHQSVAGGASQCRIAPVWLALIRSSRQTPGRQTPPVAHNGSLRTRPCRASGRKCRSDPDVSGVESRRGAPVERWREHGFRRPAPSHLCLALHFDYVSSPRSSNPACGFPALGSRSRSCARPREAAPSALSGVPDRSAAGRPESARLPGLRPWGLQPSHRRSRCAARDRAPGPAKRRPGTRFTSACYV